MPRGLLPNRLGGVLGRVQNTTTGLPVSPWSVRLFGGFLVRRALPLGLVARVSDRSTPNPPFSRPPGLDTYCIPTQGMQLQAMKGRNRLVPNIRLIEEGEATGALKAEYDAAIARAGKVFNIVKAMSLNTGTLRASMELYRRDHVRALGALAGTSASSRSRRFAREQLPRLNSRARRRPPCRGRSRRARRARDHDYRRRPGAACPLPLRLRRQGDARALRDQAPTSMPDARRAGATRRSTMRCRSISYFNYINRTRTWWASATSRSGRLTEERRDVKERAASVRRGN